MINITKTFRFFYTDYQPVHMSKYGHSVNEGRKLFRNVLSNTL